LTQPAVRYDFSAAQVQFALIPGFVAEAKRTLKISMTAEKIVARF
jgi:hypothetical protein